MSNSTLSSLFFALAITIGTGLPASSQVADHLECYKIKDSAPKLKYAADLNGLVVEPGCTISVPAKLLCVDTTKTNVAPAPPVDGEGAVEGRTLCYKVKCPKQGLPAVAWADQFGARSLSAIGSKYVCAPELAVATTTTTMPPAGPAIVVINEVVPAPAVGQDWIEFFNHGSSTADLTGWYITDSDPLNVFSFPAGTSLAPGAYLVLTANDPMSFAFGLAATGDAVNLYDSEDSLVDATAWTSGQADVPNSWGRSPNGTGAFTTLTTVTQGSANP